MKCFCLRILCALQKVLVFWDLGSEGITGTLPFFCQWIITSSPHPLVLSSSLLPQLAAWWWLLHQTPLNFLQAIKCCLYPHFSTHHNKLKTFTTNSEVPKNCQVQWREQERPMALALAENVLRENDYGVNNCLDTATPWYTEIVVRVVLSRLHVLFCSVWWLLCSVCWIWLAAALGEQNPNKV